MEKLMNKDLSEKDFLVEVFEVADLKKQNEQLREMFNMQLRVVTYLELEKIELENKIKQLKEVINTLTKNKFTVVG
jgi:hypothetical protein